VKIGSQEARLDCGIVIEQPLRVREGNRFEDGETEQIPGSFDCTRCPEFALVAEPADIALVSGQEFFARVSQCRDESISSESQADGLNLKFI
jgi:hypothetical protein